MTESSATGARGSDGPVDVRPVVLGDTAFLWEMLYWAAHVDEDDGVTLAEIRRDPDLAGHVAGWGRAGDVGVIAERGRRPVGAAWLRLFDPATSDYSVFVDDDIPELVAAVDPAAVGTGIGSMMLTRLLANADRAYPAIVLSVRANNPAMRLYERLGFRELDRHVNRVGSESARMLRASRPATESGPTV